MSFQTCRQVLFAIAGGLTLLAWVAPLQAQAVPPRPSMIEGPITGPGPMHPGMRDGPEGTNLIQDFGYVVEEYFVSGTTGVVPTPYRVRMLVWRPATPAQSTSIVVGEPTHRGGNALICQFSRYGIGQRGHVCFTVAARQINYVNPTTPAAGLYNYNPERYGSLFVSDTQTNEILAQVGWLIKNNDPDSPLASYGVTHMVMGGTSDSSGATRSYMGSAHASFRTPSGGPIYDGFFVSSTLGGSAEVTDVPTIQMPTQSELHGTSGHRSRLDSDGPSNRFRLYEISGMSHNDSRDQPEVFTGCANPLSQFPYGAMTFMGLQHVINWAAHGILPPRAQYMEIDNSTSGDGTRVATDEHGNSLGGVRTPHLDVPVYRYTIPNNGPGLCSQTGYQTRLSDATLRGLYGCAGQAEYLNRFEQRLQELLAEGWFPVEYTERYARADAKGFRVLPPDLVASTPSVSPAQLFPSTMTTFIASVTNAAAENCAGNVPVRFLVDGVALGADQSVAQIGAGASQTVTAQWSATGAGNHTVEVVIDPADAIAETDKANNSASASFVVEQPPQPPTGSLALSPNVLWPPNHKLVAITQRLSVSEGVTVSGPVVTSNEPQTGLGNDEYGTDTDVDWIVSGGSLQLRAERFGGGTGRVYTVTYTLTNSAGKSSQVSATVRVPHDQ